jgi:hypothetical protein
MLKQITRLIGSLAPQPSEMGAGAFTDILPTDRDLSRKGMIAAYCAR